MGMKILLVANTDWFLYRFRLSLARFLRTKGWDPVLASPPGSYVPRILDEGFRWRSIRMNRKGLLPYQEIMSIIRLMVLYRRENPDFLHHFTLKPVLYGSLAARWCRVPSVVNSVSGLGYLFLTKDVRGRLVRKCASLMFKYALSKDNVRIIFENPGDRDYFLDRGLVPSWKTIVIRGVGVNLEQFSPQPEPDEPVLVVMASRMLWDKGVKEFVNAARLLHQRYPEARFALVGAPDPGNPTSIPEEQLTAWVTEGVVEWWGHQDDIQDVFAKCHIVTLPSYGEGLPTVLLEAAACGRPIVASDIPGCREVVRQGETGLLVPIRDFERLANALENLIINIDLRIEMGRRGRQLVETQFDQHFINQKTFDLYNELIVEH
jgi:glycosyltransferase involved in cell wall biosynthesis